MPTYEYKCQKCSLVFEEFQSISAEPLTSCKNPDCDGTVKRLFSPGAGFLFKGSGFYITDYRSDSYKRSASSESSSSSSGSSSKGSSSTGSTSSAATSSNKSSSA